MLRQEVEYPSVPHPGIERLQQLVTPVGGRQKTALFDLDDTIKELQPVTWPSGKMRRIHPETVDALIAVRDSGLQLGVVTEQSFSEIEPFLTDVANLAGEDEFHTFFNGIIVGEGGTVVLRRSQAEYPPTPHIVYSQEYGESRTIMLNWLKDNFSEESDGDGWKVFSGVDPEVGTLMQLPPEDEQGNVTVTIWEKGPNIGTDPDYDERYAENRRVISEGIEKLGITGWRIFEAGNGTVRIVPRGRDKANMVRILSLIRGVRLPEIVYFCDGPNDIALAKMIKGSGGGIVTFANGIAELKEIADYEATQPSGLGVAEAIEKILP